MTHPGARVVLSLLALVALLVATAQPFVTPAFAVGDTALASVPVASVSGRPAAAGPYEALIVFAPDIELPTASSTTVQIDPYTRVSELFAPMLANLGCNQQAQTPAAGASPLVDCPGGVVPTAWVPFSYAGVTGGTTCATGQIASYTGQQSNQPLNQSSATLQSIIQFAKSCADASAAVPVAIGLGVGGAVGSYWVFEHPEAYAVTLDSPVNGFWTSADLASYCQYSVGLAGIVGPAGCTFAQQISFALANSAVLAQLNDPAIKTRLGNEHSANLASPSDAFVPSWLALNPLTTDANVLLPDATCPNPAGSPFAIQTNHTCVVESGAGIVYTILFSDSGCRACAYRPAQTVAITICGVAADAQISVTHAGANIPVTPVASTECAGGMQITVPWTDVLVQASVGGNVVLREGALPAENGPLTVQPQQTPTVTPIIPELPPLALFASGLLLLGGLAYTARRRG